MIRLKSRIQYYGCAGRAFGYALNKSLYARRPPFVFAALPLWWRFLQAFE